MLDQAQRRQYCLGFRAWSPEAGCQMLMSCWCVALRLHDSGDRMSRTRCRFAECGAHVGQLFLALKNKATTGKSVHGKVHAASLQLCAKDHGWHGSIFAQRNRNLREASFPQYTFIGAWFLGEGQCRCQGFEPIPTVPACHGHFMHFHACCHVSHTHGREFTHVGRCRLLLLISGEAGVLQRSSEPDRLEENDD